MAAPTAPFANTGLLAQRIQEVRRLVNEPSLRKYSNDDLVRAVGDTLAMVTQEVYAMSPAPPYAQYSFTVVADQGRYRLPPNVAEVHQIAHLDDDTRLPQWSVRPGSRHNPFGPTVVMEGTHELRLIPTPTGSSGLIGEVLTVDYIPGGTFYPHQNIAPVWDADDDGGSQIITSDTITLSEAEGSTNWRLGRFDRRPDAFVGQVVRLLSTVADATPSGHSYFPVEERTIVSYNHLTVEATVQPDFSFDPADVTDKQILIAPPDVAGRTYLLYEVLPSVDPALIQLAAYEAALTLAIAEKRDKSAERITALITRTKRAAQNRWSNFDMVTGLRFDTTPDDIYDDGMS